MYQVQRDSMRNVRRPVLCLPGQEPADPLRCCRDIGRCCRPGSKADTPETEMPRDVRIEFSSVQRSGAGHAEVRSTIFLNVSV